MWDLLINTAGTSILELSARAIGGGAVALFLLFLIAGLFKHNKDIKQYCFVLIVIIILTVSSILFTTALLQVQDSAAIMPNQGVI